jgi:hypothetical protein
MPGHGATVEGASVLRAIRSPSGRILQAVGRMWSGRGPAAEPDCRCVRGGFRLFTEAVLHHLSGLSDFNMLTLRTAIA